MKKALLSLLFAAALPALSHAGECRTWLTDDGLKRACVNDSAAASGATYEFIDADEGVGGPGILYTHPTLYLWFDPVYPVTDHAPEEDGD